MGASTPPPQPTAGGEVGSPTGAHGIRIDQVTAALLPTYRDVRIAALIDSPRAFWSTYEQARARTDDDWAAFLETGPRTWLAFDGARPVGPVGLWRGEGQPEDESTLVGMWVASVVRGTDVAERLVRTALRAASDAGVRRVVLDVAHENVRACAFYSRIGFRPTGEVNSMPWDPAVTEEQMVLDLTRDPESSPARVAARVGGRGRVAGMSEITVRPLGADDWERYRSVRLTALQESPDAFVASHEAESAEPAEFWRERMERSTRLLAEVDGEPVGIASVGSADDDQPETAQLFGLWVAPEARGTGVATALVRAGAQTAAAKGKRQLHYWVGTDNGRAVAFASGFGFRPTAERRPMRVVSSDDGEEELAMTLPLSGDRGGIAQF